MLSCVSPCSVVVFRVNRLVYATREHLTRTSTVFCCSYVHLAKAQHHAHLRHESVLCSLCSRSQSSPGRKGLPLLKTLFCKGRGRSQIRTSLQKHFLHMMGPTCAVLAVVWGLVWCVGYFFVCGDHTPTHHTPPYVLCSMGRPRCQHHDCSKRPVFGHRKDNKMKFFCILVGMPYSLGGMINMLPMICRMYVPCPPTTVLGEVGIALTADTMLRTGCPDLKVR